MSGTTDNTMVYIGTDCQSANNKMTAIPTNITILTGEWTQFNASFCGQFFFLSLIIWLSG